MVKSVAIIIPAFNAKSYILETLKSVKAQSYRNWECIIVNDGSTDETEQIVVDFIRDDERFKLFTIPNSGVCAARNYGASLAISDLLLFVDADDLIANNFLEVTVPLCNDQTIVATPFEMFGKRRRRITPSDCSNEMMIAHNQIVVTSLITKKAFDIVDGFSEYMREGFEDWELWIKLLGRGVVINVATETTVYYRVLKNSRNRSIDENKESRLRRLIWSNNRELFDSTFLNPLHSFEYRKLRNSAEVKVGCYLLRPLRYMLSIL